jgi:hypothetical protein
MGIHEGILHWAKHMNNNNGKKFKFKWEHAMKEGHKTCLWSPYEKIKIFFFLIFIGRKLM